jgi:hypothetical protein
MNKIFYLLIGSFLFLSCGKDVTFNRPAFQAEAEGLFWKADQYIASIGTNGVLYLQGQGNGQSVILKVPNAEVGTYFIVPSSFGVYGEYSALAPTGATITYGTLNTNLAVGTIVGEIKVSNISGADVSGTFNFRAYRNGGAEETAVTFGVFDNVPLASGDLPLNGCSQATQVADAAAATYAATLPNADEFPDVCNAYKQALILQKTICGDDTGVIQALITGLGDCLGANGDGSLSAIINGNTIVFDSVFVDQVGSQVQVLGEVVGADTTISFNFDAAIDPLTGVCVPVADANCGVDQIRDLTLTLGGVTFGDVDPDFPYFPDPDDVNATPSYMLGNIITNVVGPAGGNSSFSGTLNGVLFENNNTANTQIQLNNGIINLNYQ